MAITESNLATVRALIARTASDFENESISCAKNACRMIRELGMDVVDPAAVNASASLREVQGLRAKVAERDAIVAKMRGAVSDLVSQNTKLQADLRIARSHPESVTISPSAETVAAASRALSQAVLGKIGGEPARRTTTRKRTKAKVEIPVVQMPESGKIVVLQNVATCQNCKSRIAAGRNVFWSSDGVLCMKCAEDE
jgi:hypothetical protein